MKPIHAHNKSKIKRVRVLFLNKVGYGPEGSFTRKTWRDECLKYFLAGKEVFKKWQESWIETESSSTHRARFDTWIRLEDGTRRYITQNVLNRCTIDFAGTTFDQYIEANNYVFLTDVCFSGCTFNNLVYFGESIFKGDAEFIFSRFNRSLECRDSTFESNARFDDAYFEDSVHFDYSSFNASADFNDVIFNGYAGFKRATFESDTEFNNVKFCYLAEFKSANFNWDAEFETAIFLNDTSFFKSIFKDTVNFVSAVFAADVNFEDCIFENVGHFQDTKFTKKIPCFLGVSMTSRLEFSDESYFSHLDITEKGIANLRVLKRLSDEHGLTDHAISFNAMELRAKRLQTEPKTAAFSFRLITWAYELFSDYGRSFVRPIIFYVVLICLSFMYSYTYTPSTSDSLSITNKEFCKPPEKEPQLLNLSRGRAAFEYAMFRAGGLMDFTDTGKQNNAVNCRLFEEPIEPPLMRAWGIFKGIASIALLFLAALGLRNKYRIK